MRGLHRVPHADDVELDHAHPVTRVGLQVIASPGASVDGAGNPDAAPAPEAAIGVRACRLSMSPAGTSCGTVDWTNPQSSIAPALPGNLPAARIEQALTSNKSTPAHLPSFGPSMQPRTLSQPTPKLLP